MHGQRKRVAIVGPVYPYRAGIAHCTTRLGEVLSERYDVTLVSFRRQYPGIFYPGGADIDPTLIEKTPPSARFELDVANPLTWWREGRSIAGEAPDAVVFVWWVWVWALPYLVIRRMLPRSTKVVFQCHNLGHKEPAAWKGWLTSLVLRTGDLLLVQTDVEKEAGLAQYKGDGAPRIEKLFLPVLDMGGEARDRGEARERLGLPEGDLALFFGYIRPYKRLEIALRAWSLLRTDAKLVVAGEIWFGEKDRYHRLVRELGIEQRVRFETRFIPDAEIGDWFSAADVVVAPYQADGTSGVALTAFHFARPVIATRVGGIPEAIDDGVEGLLVPPEDSGALAVAIDDFFARRDRRAMERAAADRARTWSWSVYGERLADLLD